jgi:hypothetical protein
MGLMLLDLELDRSMLKDTIGMLFVTAFAITFFTNMITTEYNVWALMVRFGGAG